MTDIEATKLLDAAKQALEVLEDFVDDPRCQKQIDEAATALRQAISELEQRSIAEAEQEPVGCIAKDGSWSKARSYFTGDEIGRAHV